MKLAHLKILHILTMLLAISLALVSVAGAFLPDTYARDSASMAAQGVGQDLVDLFLGVPLLLVSFYYTSKGNRIWTLIYSGVLFYIMYSFIIYCFGVYFNRFFLLYCFTEGLALYSFILVVSALRQQSVGEWFDNPPVKTISIYIFFVALVFYALWLKSIVPALVSNEVPKDISDYNLLVNPVHVIDLVFALPALIIGSVLLWKKHSLGFLIVSTALVFMVLLTIALAAMVIVLVVKEINENFTIAIVFGTLAVVSVTMSVLLFRRIKTPVSI